MTRVVNLIRASRTGEARDVQAQIIPLADRLERLTNQLVNLAEADMVDAIDTTERAYVTSRRIVVSFAVASILLALAFGYIISWSLIGPVQTIEAHLRQIAAGNFAQQVTVTNRDELGMLAANVNQTSEQLGRLYREIETRTHELAEALTYQTATGEVLKTISGSTLHLQPVLDTLVETATQLCRADKGCLFRLEEGLYRLRASFGFEQEFRRPSKTIRSGPMHQKLWSGGPPSERRVLHFDDFVTDAPLHLARGTKFWWLPHCTGRATIARRRAHWRDRDSPVITLSRSRASRLIWLLVFADQAVIAIENARLVRELQEQSVALATSVEELKALAETGQAVSGTLDLTRVLDLISASAMALGESEACVLFRYDRTNRRFILWRATGLEEALSAQIRSLQILEAETVMGTAVRQHAPVSVDDLGRLPSWPLRDVALGAGIRSVLIVPLVRAERIFGTLVLLRREEGEFPRRTIDVMQTFANQSVLAIQNARLFREIEDKSRQLEIASQHKSQFLANMSHELRTPLNAVLGYTEMLLDGVYGEVAGEAHEILEYVQSNGEHLLALINDVLDLSKIEAGQFTLTLDDYAAQSVIEAVLTVAQPLAQAKDLNLQVSIADDLPLGRGDERRLTQVLLNVVGNAIKFTDAGAVRITASAAGDAFELAVTDTGPGIALVDQERIFDVFHQVDNSSTREKGGRGWGSRSQDGLSRCMVEQSKWSLLQGKARHSGSLCRFTWMRSWRRRDEADPCR